MGADRRRLELPSRRSSAAAPLPGAATTEPARGRMPPPEPAAALPNPGLRGAEKPVRPLPNSGVCCCCAWPPLGVRAVVPPRAPAAAGLPPAPTLALLELRASLEKDGRCGSECRSTGVAGSALRPALPALPGVEAAASMPRSALGSATHGALSCCLAMRAEVEPMALSRPLDRSEYAAQAQAMAIKADRAAQAARRCARHCRRTRRHACVTFCHGCRSTYTRVH